jgi:hypothetical protein
MNWLTTCHLNSSMKDMVELTRLYLNETPDSDDIELLNEFIGLRTGAIVMGLGKVKQYASKLDQEINSLRANLSDLRKSTPEDGPEKLADALETMGKLFWLQRKMGMYTALTAAATGVGVEKTNKLLKKLKK